MDQPTTQVLLIEDNPGDADLVRLRLVEGKSPVNVNCVNRLADGLAALSKELPSVVLLDLNLPDSHGAETFRRVLEHSPNVPVVVLSGQDDEALAAKAIHQGAQDYLIKGNISSKHLERAIRYAVERQALLRALEVTQKQQLEFKNQFLSHVSHELRTPLTCIHQYVTLLLDGLAGPLVPDQGDHLKTVLKSVNQLHAMIRDLLEATRAESGKLRVEPRCIALGELMQQTVAMLRPTANEKQIGLEIGLDQRLPLVHADPDRVLEVLINLVDNAIKFTPPEGAVMLQASMVEADPDSVYVAVSDTGRGISPEAKTLIFERLYQDGDSIDNNRSGLGLGLFICKEIVKLHQGRIWVSSEPGQGSIFTFTLPVYSLAKLLAPVVIYQNQLRPSFVLVRVELTPLTSPPRGNWKETWRQCLETLRHCVYLDKDLVLPPMGAAGTAETFYVVASTDLQQSGVMTARIREQLERVMDLQSKCTVTISAVPIELPAAQAGESLERQVQTLAECVSEMILKNMDRKQFCVPKAPGSN
ncbi:MAG TPA: hybrid sensor histidine kinase/response regulator [Candidatus Aquilonibacter sp.]|jgi:sigma-B regulation protein RsbU (phosphoserine phosphatase)|nr:hybrid sensor histidine kinase/response regulator [Candidatus Aquilonibacter sp.]